MKRMFLIAVCIAAGFSAAAQTDTIRISNNVTTHIRFASEIKYVDLSSRVLVAKIVEGSKDILALKAREQFDFATTMSCLEASGEMHTFFVKYCDTPSELVYDSRKSKEAGQMPTSLLSRALDQKKSLYHIGDKGNGMAVFCDNLFIKDDVLYVVMDFQNRSSTTFALSEPRFSVESRKRTKRELVFEKQIFPRNVLVKEAVSPRSSEKMVFSFDKISVLDGQVFRVYLYESGGARNYILTFSSSDISKAAPLP